MAVKHDDTKQERDSEQEGEILQQLDELVSYYKELYSLLSAQAMRQVKSVRISLSLFFATSLSYGSTTFVRTTLYVLFIPS